MSDGAACKPHCEEVFPNLPDSVLESMGLLGESPRYFYLRLKSMHASGNYLLWL